MAEDPLQKPQMDLGSPTETLAVRPQATPDATVFVNPGNVTLFDDETLTPFAGGSSAAFPALAGIEVSRWDLLALNLTVSPPVLQIVPGTPSIAPQNYEDSVPKLPAGRVALAAIEITDVSPTPVVVNTGDIEDVRSYYHSVKDQPENFQVFTSNGSFVIPDHVTRVRVEAWGAGGGGGGAAAATEGAGGGGGGGWVQALIDVTPGETYDVTIGAGGAGGATTPTAGGNGGDSVFELQGGGPPDVTAGGGVGGAVADSIGGAGGTNAVNGVVVSDSVAGRIGAKGSGDTGDGGDSTRGGFGGRSATVASAYAGVAGDAPGGGGSGGHPGAGAAQVGGAGAAGRVVVWY